jgi:hypothetical protein
MSNVDDFLKHYGKQGMKWGSRKAKTSGSRSKNKLAKPKAKDLSDEDLRKAVNRMQMERQYNVLVGNKTASSKGAAFAKSVGGNVLKTTVTAVATQQVASALKKAKIAK